MFRVHCVVARVLIATALFPIGCSEPFEEETVSINGSRVPLSELYRHTGELQGPPSDVPKVTFKSKFSIPVPTLTLKVDAPIFACDNLITERSVPRLMGDQQPFCTPPVFAPELTFRQYITHPLPLADCTPVH